MSRSGVDPFVELYGVRALFAFQLNKLVNRACGKDERNQNSAAGDDAHDGLGEPLSEEPVDDETCGRKQWDQPNEVQKIHRLLKFEILRLPLHQIDLVDVHRFLVLEHRDDDPQADRGFCRSHGYYKYGEHLTRDLLQAISKTRSG